MDIEDISTKTVYQQIALRMRFASTVLGLAATATGVSAISVSRVETDRVTREIDADTVYQQMAIRVSVTTEMLELITEKLIE